MDRLDQQEKEFKVFGIKELFRGPLLLTLLALAVIYIVYQHNQMLEMMEENRNREVTLQDKLYNNVINRISPDLHEINQNINRTNELIDSITQK